MKTKMTLSIVLTSFMLSMCITTGQNEQITRKASQTQLKELSTAYFASGCFWCVEAVFESVRGVEEAVSGYAGGNKQNPTYRQIGTGQTGHSETVEVYYDPKVVSYETLVKVFYGSHNPTTVNGQHPDYGSQYRSIIFYQNDEEKKIAESFKAKLAASGKYDQPIATEIVPLVKFWKAEDYHQDYERLNPDNGYVRNVSVPRLRKFQKKFPELLKEGH
jgi:peptide-methionine (S)-S-oxide reductase